MAAARTGIITIMFLPSQFGPLQHSKRLGDAPRRDVGVESGRISRTGAMNQPFQRDFSLLQLRQRPRKSAKDAVGGVVAAVQQSRSGLPVGTDVPQEGLPGPRRL